MNKGNAYFYLIPLSLVGIAVMLCILLATYNKFDEAIEWIKKLMTIF